MKLLSTLLWAQLAIQSATALSRGDQCGDSETCRTQCPNSAYEPELGSDSVYFVCTQLADSAKIEWVVARCGPSTEKSRKQDTYIDFTVQVCYDLDGFEVKGCGRVACIARVPESQLEGFKADWPKQCQFKGESQNTPTVSGPTDFDEARKSVVGDKQC